MRKHILLCTLFCAAICYGQSLADTARQEREKEATKDSAPAPKVITNDDLDSGPVNQALQHNKKTQTNAAKMDQETAAFARKAEKAKTAILAQKARIKSMQTQIAKMRASIRYVETGVPLNQNQMQKQQAADRMQEQLDGEVKKLEAMQEAARRAGF